MKKVLVAGGSRGIGAAITEKFAGEGCKVVFIYGRSSEAAKKLSEKCGAAGIQYDLSKAEECEKAFSEAIGILGGIDVLVTCAGISHIAQVCDTSNDDWQRIMDTNLSSAFILSREASKIMVKNHSGRIITIGSVWGRYGASCEVAYSASKAGIRGLTKALSKELAPSGITVNCIEPGVINTDMNSHFSDDDKKLILEDIPAGRMGEPSEVAALCSFLASDEASYITGQCIGIGGGFGD